MSGVYIIGRKKSKKKRGENAPHPFASDIGVASLHAHCSIEPTTAMLRDQPPPVKRKKPDHARLPVSTRNNAFLAERFSAALSPDQLQTMLFHSGRPPYLLTLERPDWREPNGYPIARTIPLWSRPRRRAMLRRAALGCFCVLWRVLPQGQTVEVYRCGTPLTRGRARARKPAARVVHR